MERMTAKAFRLISGTKTAVGGAKPKKGHKYSAESVVINGIRFDSKKEGARYVELGFLLRAGLIRDLELQVPVMLEGRDGPIKTRTGRGMRITVDFKYFDVALGIWVWEDAKGMPTRDYEVRRAVAGAMGIEVTEV